MTLFARAGFLYLLVCMGLLAAILILGSGHFTFVIDDPYIHLAMAENLPGHLGLNLEEATDASSSILYPWLLAPFAHSEGAGIGMALALNALAGLGCLYFFARLAGSACQGWLGAVALVGLAAAVNLFALVFMGMEHTLHVLCALALVCGLKDYAATGGLPRWFWLAFFIAPLVRFEALALNALILGWLLLDRRWLWVLAGSLAVALPQVAHAYWLNSLGLPILPTSVLLKSDTIAFTIAHFSAAGTLIGMLYDLLMSLMDYPGTLVVVILALALSLLAFSAPNHRRLCLCIALAVWAHLLLGRFGWMGRYSAYVYALALPTLALACAPWLAQAGTPRRLAGGGLAILLILSGLQHLVYLPLIPRAAQQVYLQSWQMHRLLVEFWQKPAFALDIGAVSWLNPQPVWDLSGLASEPIRQMLLTYRVGSTSQTYLADVTRKYQTQLALMMDRPNMIAPASWVPLARLELPDANIILHRNMDIYATSQEAVPAAKAAVLAWGASLPPQARLGLNPAVFAP